MTSTTETIQPAVNAVVNYQPTQNSPGLTQTAINTTRNIHPADATGGKDNQMSNTVSHSQMRNSQTLGITPSYPLPTTCCNAVVPKQPAENAGLYGQSANGNLVFGYPTTWYGYQMYGDPGASTGYGSTIMSSTTDQGSSVGLLDSIAQLMNTFDLSMVYGQPPTNTPSQGSVVGQPAAIQPSDAESLAARNEDTRGRNTAGYKSRDPRKSRSRLYGRCADAPDEDEPVAKKVHLESLPQEDSRKNCQGIFLS